jgi:wobble nucleotide-excising tRNase
MLRRFSSITSCGIFQNFRWNSVAPDFQRINLIYGPNGSGKTSLANALADLSSESTSYSKVSICMSNADKTNERNSDKKLDNEFQRIFVFGDGYVKQNLQFDGDADSTVAAVLTVGKRTIQEEARIAELKPLIDQSEKDLTDAKKGLANAKKNLDNRYRTLASSIVASLSRAGGRYKSNGTYHRGIVKSLFDQSHDSWKLLTPEQKKISIATVNSDEKKPVSSRSFSFQVRTD